MDFRSSSRFLSGVVVGYSSRLAAAAAAAIIFNVPLSLLQLLSLS